MELLRLDIDGNFNHKKLHDNSSSSQDFEEINSCDGSMDAGKIKSFKISPQSSDDFPTNLMLSRRDETVIEKIKDIGTNLKYNFEVLSQSLWIRDNADEVKAFLLGKEYSAPTDDKNQNRKYRIIEKEFSKIIWFTYRKNFPKLNYKELPSAESYVSDTGWGCMIRACQMMFAETLQRCLNPEKNEEICIENEINNTNSHPTIRSELTLRQPKSSSRKEEARNKRQNVLNIISWFLDSEVNPTSSPYSIQNLSTFLFHKFNLQPGNWFKPSNVLLCLQKIHETYGKHTIPNLEIEVFSEGTVYLSQILKKVTSHNLYKMPSFFDFETGFEIIEEEDEVCITSSLEVPSSKKDLTVDERTFSNENIKNDLPDIEKLMNLKWNSSLVLFVMAKIGLDKPNPEYIPFIKEFLSYPESIGMIGGKPGLAYYIVGYIDDKLMYLDPHFVQESIHKKRELKDNINSYYCNTIKYANFHEIDTSVTFGFFFRNESDFKKFLPRFKSSCEEKDSFLSLIDHPPQNELLNLEDVEDEGEFELISLK